MAVQAMVFDQISPINRVEQIHHSKELVKLKESTIIRILKLGYQVEDISEGQMNAWRISNSYQQVQIHTLEELIHFGQTQTSIPVQMAPINNNVLEIAIMFGILGTCASISYFMTLA
jgi:hypothetical protein